MFNRIATLFLFKLLASRLGITAPAKRPLSEVGLSEYTLDVMKNNDLHTVEEALFAYCLHHPTPGIGQGSWNNFLSCVS